MAGLGQPDPSWKQWGATELNGTEYQRHSSEVVQCCFKGKELKGITFTKGF